MIQEINSFSAVSFDIIFSHSELSFHLVYSFLPCAKAFKFNQFSFVYFCFYFHYSQEVGHRGSCCDLCQRVFCLFSSKSFIVSGLTFRALIHFEFIFVCGVRKCFSFILLQVVDQFSQHHLLKRLPFSPLYILVSFVKDKVSIGAWVYLWAFYLFH